MRPTGRRSSSSTTRSPADAAAVLAELDRRDPGAPGIQTEVVGLSARLGAAAALNAGIRRASAPVVVILDGSVEPTGDVITPLVEALEDPSVAVAGPFGIVSRDLRQFEEPAEDTVDVDVIEGYALAFRRTDFVDRGPLDEHFVFYRNLDIWWSLVLRDGDWDAAVRRSYPSGARSASRGCPSSATSIGVGRACPTPNATGSRRRTSTGC